MRTSAIQWLPATSRSGHDRTLYFFTRSFVAFHQTTVHTIHYPTPPHAPDRIDLLACCHCHPCTVPTCIDTNACIQPACRAGIFCCQCLPDAFLRVCVTLATATGGRLAFGASEHQHVSLTQTNQSTTMFTVPSISTDQRRIFLIGAAAAAAIALTITIVRLANCSNDPDQPLSKRQLARLSPAVRSPAHPLPPTNTHTHRNAAN
jgi:hypothetical protein